MKLYFRFVLNIFKYVIFYIFIVEIGFIEDLSVDENVIDISSYMEDFIVIIDIIIIIFIVNLYDYLFIEFEKFVEELFEVV